MKKYVMNYGKNNLVLIQGVNLVMIVTVTEIWLRNFCLVANKVTGLMKRIM
jgi:hypothetical protein